MTHPTVEYGNESPALILGHALAQRHEIEDGGEWPYYVGRMPDSVNQGLVLTDTTPLLYEKGMRSLETLIYPGVQIRLRCNNYQLGYNKIRSIQRACDTLYREQISVDGCVYLLQAVRSSAGVFPLGHDDRNRDEFTLNVLLTLSVA